MVEGRFSPDVDRFCQTFLVQIRLGTSRKLAAKSDPRIDKRKRHRDLGNFFVRVSKIVLV